MFSIPIYLNEKKWEIYFQLSGHLLIISTSWFWALNTLNAKPQYETIPLINFWFDIIHPFNKEELILQVICDKEYIILKTLLAQDPVKRGKGMLHANFRCILNTIFWILFTGSRWKDVPEHPDFCVSQRGFESSEEFLRVLQTSKCSDITWSVFGVPASLLNAMLHGSVFWGSIRLKRKKTLLRGASWKWKS